MTTKKTACKLFVFSTLFVLLFITLLSAADESVNVVIEGLSGDELQNAEILLKLPDRIVKEGKVDAAWLRRFERQIPGKIREALEPYGYYHPETAVSIKDSAEGIRTLIVKVDPGKPILIKSVNVKMEGAGEKERQLNDVVNRFPLNEGDVLRHDRYEKAKDQLRDKAIELGYLDADFSIHRIDITLSSLSAEINLVFNTGIQYKFGDIAFLGAPDYPVSFLKRYLDFKPGEVFSYAKIAKTQFNFIGADRFKEVVVNPRKDDTQDDKVPMDVKLVPSPPKRLRFGVGYGTDTGARGTVIYQDFNFLNYGHLFSAELQASQILQGFAARYVFPDEKDFKSYTAFTFGLQREDVSDKTTNVTSLEGEHARSFGPEQLGSFYVRMQKEHSIAGDQRTNTFLLMPGVRYSSRQYNNIIRPTKGYYYDLELRGANKVFGSDTDFIQFLTNGEMMFQLPARLTFLSRGRFGTSSIGGATEDLPISLRFFAGGSRSIRGYNYQSLGPVDDKGDVVGGKNLLVMNFELERAIGEDWGVAAFYDTGNAFNNYSNIDFTQGAGLGVRYYTPIGSMNLDVARQIGVSSPDFKIHFTIGIRI